MHKLSKGHLLAFEVTLENDKLALKDLILVLGAALQLLDGNFKLAVHVILLLLCFTLLLVKFLFLSPNVLETFYNIFKRATGITVTHDINLKIGNGLLKIALLYSLGGQWSLHFLHTRFEVSNYHLRVGDLSLDVLVLLL